MKRLRRCRLTQIALHDAGMVEGRVQFDDGGVQPGGATPVHQLSVDHRGLSVNSSAMRRDY